MKASMHRVFTELKTTKKLNRFSFEFVLRIKAIVDSLLLIGDLITEQFYGLLETPPTHTQCKHNYISLGKSFLFPTFQPI